MHHRHHILLPSAFVCCLWLASCLNPFSPKLETDGEQIQIVTPQTTPEELFQNFAYAYTFRDSLLYADLLDSQFVFEFFDPNIGESGAFESWGRNVELRTTGRLLAVFETIELIWLKVFFQSEEENNQVRIYRDFRLRLIGSDLNITLNGSGLFTFVRGVDDKWRIRRWIDESNL